MHEKVYDEFSLTSVTIAYIFDERHIKQNDWLNLYWQLFKLVNSWRKYILPHEILFTCVDRECHNIDIK